MRPPERWSRVSACIAVVVGERAAIWATAVPSLILDVRAAIQVSGVKASEPQDSAVHTEWYPSRSASWASGTWSAEGPRPQ